MYYWRHLFLVSVGDVLQVYETPVFELPVAPAGAQNAPGVTNKELLLSIGVGVGVTKGVTEGVTTGVGVALTIGAGTGVFETPRPQELINAFNFVASLASKVKAYLVFTAIQFSV
jgi:hypothetical protein